MSAALPHLGVSTCLSSTIAIVKDTYLSLLPPYKIIQVLHLLVIVVQILLVVDLIGNNTKKDKSFYKYFHQIHILYFTLSVKGEVMELLFS